MSAVIVEAAKSEERLLALVEELRGLPAETEWVEFKENLSQPDQIGKTVSALSNSACIAGKHNAFLLWGIRDNDHAVVGTTLQPGKKFQGNETLEFWLAKALSPSLAFKFYSVEHPHGRVLVLEIPAASSVPVKFSSIAYVRIGNATPKLADYPEREADLVTKLRPFVWEHGAASHFVTGDDVIGAIDVDNYFKLVGVARPSSAEAILHRLGEERLIARDVGGRWNILNLGAILFGLSLSSFENLTRKALRVVQYDGDTKIRTNRIQEGARGYAAGFKGALSFIDSLLPVEEVIVDGIRKTRRAYPEIAIRELLANALIHQDMTVSGSGPIVEIYGNRIEISNPGVPVTDMLKKLFGAPPRSRNEHMGRLMRRMGICEELGAGLVRVITEVEDFKLPAPRFDLVDGHTRVTLYGPRPYTELDRSERVQICYQHTCLMSHRGKRMTNASLRDRLGIKDENAAVVSRLIKETATFGLIRPADPERPKAGYLPYWA